MIHRYDDKDTASLTDRLIAGVIGGFFGYWIGLAVALIVGALFESRFGSEWIVLAICAAYAFVAPARAQALWTSIWRETGGRMSGGL